MLNHREEPEQTENLNTENLNNDDILNFEPLLRHNPSLISSPLSDTDIDIDPDADVQEWISNLSTEKSANPAHSSSQSPINIFNPENKNDLHQIEEEPNFNFYSMENLTTRPPQGVLITDLAEMDDLDLRYAENNSEKNQTEGEKIPLTDSKQVRKIKRKDQGFDYFVCDSESIIPAIQGSSFRSRKYRKKYRDALAAAPKDDTNFSQRTRITDPIELETLDLRYKKNNEKMKQKKGEKIQLKNSEWIEKKKTNTTFTYYLCSANSETHVVREKKSRKKANEKIKRALFSAAVSAKKAARIQSYPTPDPEIENKDPAIPFARSNANPSQEMWHPLPQHPGEAIQTAPIFWQQQYQLLHAINELAQAQQKLARQFPPNYVGLLGQAGMYAKPRVSAPTSSSSQKNNPLDATKNTHLGTQKKW